MADMNQPTDAERGPEFDRLYRLMHTATAPQGPGGASLTTFVRFLFDNGVRIIPSPSVCPECKAGKCGNCDGTAWDNDRDQLTGCACEHGATRGTVR